jgi:hypothetical protein
VLDMLSGLGLGLLPAGFQSLFEFLNANDIIINPLALLVYDLSIVLEAIAVLVLKVLLG